MSSKTKKALKISGAIIFALVAIFFLGPRQKAPKLETELIDSLPKNILELEKFIKEKESKIKNLKPENDSKIYWAKDSLKVKTEYCFVYLHGFSASREEANGIYPELSEKYNANIYLPRLQAHGTQSDDNLLDFNIEKYWQSAQEALLVAQKLGDKVIVMGTSTGGTLALMLAAEYDLEAILLYSPNIDLYDKTTSVLKMPWGLQIVRLVFGGKHRSFEATEAQQKYWQHRYRLEALVRLKVMLSAYMTQKTFEKITEPVFLAYYYKNEKEQDNVVSVKRMHEMFEQLGTPESKKQKNVFPEAGGHVLTWLPDAKHNIENIKDSTFTFLDKILKTGTKQKH